jgi:RND family efflux transporter MFP subunit
MDTPKPDEPGPRTQDPPPAPRAFAPHEGVAAPRRRARVPVVLATGVGVVLALGALLVSRARGAVVEPPLSAGPKPVTVVRARAATYRDRRRYVGTVEPWTAARVGPQLVSAYVDTVLVRPGAAVRRGQVIATLDCRNASAANAAVSMQARAVATTQAALANRAARMSTLLEGGFAAPDAVEMRKAESESKEAQLLAMRAQMAGASLQVQDCVLRAPFDGEVAERFVDPGAFARPGTPIATVVDRSMVRVTADIPESDFGSVAPGTPVGIHLLATGQDVTSAVSRRAPAADPSTRTVHVEIDLPNRGEGYPVGTTAEVRLDVGRPVPATEIPLAAAAIRGQRASLAVVEGGVAHRRTVQVEGERGAALFLDAALPPGALVVLEGRDALADGDRVVARPVGADEPATPALAPAPPPHPAPATIPTAARADGGTP